jgi:hypothetical protein
MSIPQISCDKGPFKDLEVTYYSNRVLNFSNLKLWIEEKPTAQRFVVRGTAVLTNVLCLSQQFVSYDIAAGGMSSKALVRDGVYQFSTYVAQRKGGEATLDDAKSFYIFQKIDVLYCAMCMMKLSPTSCKKETAILCRGRNTSGKIQFWFLFLLFFCLSFISFLF